jgi:holo-[acyl-carrier protein] synthase
MVKIGTDISSIARISSVYKKYGIRFLKRILTDTEIAYVSSSDKHLISRLAGRFAAKEAASKALGTGWYGLSFREIEVLKKESGEPVLKLHGRANKRASELGCTDWQISISHEREFAIAFVIGSNSQSIK